MTPEERFWSHVNKSGPTVREDLGPCWMWTASRNKGAESYGRMFLDGKLVLAHRVSYALHFGEIPPGVGHHGTCVCHRCDNRGCVNPDHLFLGSHRDNMVDRDSKGRNGVHTHPELLSRGENHYLRRHPECVRRGEGHHGAKLSEVDVVLIRFLSRLGSTQKQMAQWFGVGQATICRAVTGACWSHLKEGVG